jgi:hypothetical protein
MTLLSSERCETTDPLSGRIMVRWTSSFAEDQHPRVTPPSDITHDALSRAGVCELRLA